EEPVRNEFTVRVTYEVSEIPTPPLEIGVEAAVVEAGAPVSVAATDVVEGEDGLPAHSVAVTWNGESTANLEDARFTHHVTAEDGEGDLVIAGRGCAPHWEDERVVHVCTDDLRIVELAPGETHEYPVRITPELGPLTLAPGTYIV